MVARSLLPRLRRSNARPAARLPGRLAQTPIAHSNINDPLNPTIYQGKTVSGSYQDEAHSFKLAGSNSYFNPKMVSSGKL